VGRLRHVDDEERVDFLASVLRHPSPPAEGRLSVRERRLLTMLCLSLWDREKRFASLDEALVRLWEHGAIRGEIAQLVEYLGEQATQVTLDGGLGPDVSLRVHERYTRTEVLAALGESTIAAPKPSREGVYFARSIPADVLFVTLQKTLDRFSPTTMYHDYAVSPTRFHWESQSTTAAASPTGQRYIHHRAHGPDVLLFVRETQDSPSGGRMPFLFLGKAEYAGHRGERPMQIVWQLAHAMPADFFQAARAVA
ncbi:MAG: DUF3427 domain-containing protein, partial [Chloroflexota bacterium]|nr:DUF3427 domain-containing protein [Chloroflexota bacterium]